MGTYPWSTNSVPQENPIRGSQNHIGNDAVMKPGYFKVIDVDPPLMHMYGN